MNLKALRPANVEPLFCDYFDLNVRWRGGRRAVMFEGATLLWRELGGRCYQVANRLGYLGLGPGDAVVVLLENRLETAEIVLGVIRSGACLVPINLTISDDAVLRQIADCAAAAIFASREEALRVTAATAELGVERRVAVGASLEGWSEFEDWREGSKSEAPDRVPEPDHALTVVYSSGTTGVPKGIVHTHLTRTRNMLDIGRILRLSEDTVWIASLGFYSNAAILPFLITLLLGGSVVILHRFEPRSFLSAIERRGGTHFLAVPLMLKAMLAETSFDKFDISTMELIVVGGATVDPEVKELGRRRFDCVLLELYGLTEGFVTITSSADGAEKRASVGRPIVGSDLRIALEDGTSAPVGETGEIVGLAQSIMVGYLNRPEETAAVFYDDERGRRWFRTGDLGKIDEDGFLYYVGRKKDLIVSGGQNIYPVDIEGVGRGHPAVKQIAVVGMPHPRWDETPLAVIVLHEGASASTKELADWINARVGRRQKVAAAIIVESMPVNALGKVLKRELREMVLKPYSALGSVGDPSEERS